MSVTTLDNPTLLKIGCFGSVITFSPHRPVCQTCPLLDACAKKVFEREPAVADLVRLRETERGAKSLDEVEAKTYSAATKYFATRRKRYLKKDQPKSSRAKSDYDAMVAAGIDFTEIAKGNNPFKFFNWSRASEYLHMREGVDFILMERVVKATDLQEWLLSAGVCKTSSTARVYANKIIAILLLSGQIVKEGKVYCLPS